jgi:anaerobic magnesium-protoporphyrin IX monomethyl ester cyclase
MLLKYIEALLKRDGRFEVRLLDGWLRDGTPVALQRKLANWSPDVVVLMPHPVDLRGAVDFARDLRSQDGAFLVAVGPAVDLNRPALLSADSPFDLALPGESEAETLAVVERLNTEGPAAVRAAYRSAGEGRPFTVDDLDSLPFPSYSKSEVASYSFSSYPLRMSRPARWGFLLSSRGCPYGCYFCSPVMRKTSGPVVRLRRARSVVDEIEHLMACGANVISFEDDNLSVSKDHLLGICREIRQRCLAVNWICHARVDELDQSMMKEMKEAGCVLLRLGVESASDRVLNLLRKNPRGLPWMGVCKTTFAAARRAGIATNALVIIGSPGETRDEVEQTIELVLELDPDIVQVHFFTLYPGSPAYDAHSSRVTGDQVASMHHYGRPVANVSQIPTDELWKTRSEFYKRFLLRPSFLLRHAYHHGAFYLCNPQVVRGLSRVAGII